MKHHNFSIQDTIIINYTKTIINDNSFVLDDMIVQDTDIHFDKIMKRTTHFFWLSTFFTGLFEIIPAVPGRGGSVADVFDISLINFL